MSTRAIATTATVFQDLAGDLPPEGVLIHVPGHLVKEFVHDSPFQYRRTYNEAKLDELAENIRETGGIHQPLLARRRFPNVLRTHYEHANGIELAAGHRRKLGGLRAELASFPILVKDLTDDQVCKIQITENLQREDVHAFEEAEGFAELIRRGGTNIDELAKTFGKSRSYVYGRIKLLQACPTIRDACIAGTIGSEVALLIARLRTTKLQEKALQYIKGRFISLEDGGKASHRQVADLLAEHFTLDLKAPIFDPTDALLLPGAGACGDCPKRVGNAPEFADLLTSEKSGYSTRTYRGNADVCTDPDCYAEKKAAHLKIEASKLEQSGKAVIDGNKARAAVSATGEVKGAYIALKDVKRQLSEARGAAKKDSTIVPPQVVTIQDPRTGKTFEAVKRSDLAAAGVKVAAPKPKDDYEAQRRAREAETERKEALARAEEAARVNVLISLREKIKSTERSAFDMSLIARATFAGVGWHGKPILAELWNCSSGNDIEDAITTMTPDELMLFMFDCALVGDCAVQWHSLKDKPTDLLNVAAYYGVDVAAARGDKAASTPSTAARAAKGAQAEAESGTTPASTSTKAPAARAAKTAKKKPAAAGAGVDLIGDPIAENQSMEAGSAGEKAKDEPADAGAERDPNTSDMFEGAQA